MYGPENAETRRGTTRMATKKQAAHRKRFAAQARAKGKTKVGKAAASRTRRKKKR